MTVSSFRVAKSETRELADRDHVGRSGLRLSEPTEWRMSNETFFTAFVVICGSLALLALLLR
jgi:hypothetical protein